MNVDFKVIKIDYKFCWPQCGKVVRLFFEKPLKIAFFAWDLHLGKNGRFELLGWLNECRYPFLIVIILKWTSRQWKSPFICFWLFSESFFPFYFNHETLCFENGVVWCRRLCHNDSGIARLVLWGQISEIWSQITLSGPKIFVWPFGSFLALFQDRLAPCKNWRV